MPLHHYIEIAASALFFFGLWMCLLGLTFVLMDLFTDWYSKFKQARKNKAEKLAAPPAKDGKAGQ